MEILDKRMITTISTIHKGDIFIYQNSLYICFKSELRNDGVPNLHCVDLKNGETKEICGGTVECVDVECHIVGNKYPKESD